MILKEFSQYLQEQDEETSSVIHLKNWVTGKIKTPAMSNVDRIIQKEMALAENNYKNYLIIGKSPSGRKLVESLYNFALSFEQQKMARWIHNKNPKDFKNC